MHMTSFLVLIFNVGLKEVGFLVVVNEGLGGQVKNWSYCDKTGFEMW